MTLKKKHIQKKIIAIFTLAHRHIGSFFYLLICPLIWGSCAQIVAPGGGKKDITPPKVVKYVPDSASLNFKSKSIEIVFDEFIQLRDLGGQLIISPLVENTPDIKVKNKSLFIDFDKNEKLKPNTTYVINFGNALQDIHENNSKENFSYIFSTGSFIDSLIVKGKVENAFDHKVEKGVLVMLYSNFSDSVIYKIKPDYFAKTKEGGIFQINNIRDGKYKLLVLKDGNANYKYDGEAESIGFINDLILPVEKKDISIEMFQEPAKKLFLKRTIYDSYGKIVFIFNKTADSIHLQPLNNKFNEEDILLEYSKNKDTLNYWFRNIDKESLTLQVSNGNKIMDTVEFKLIKKEAALKNKKNPFKLFLLSSPGANQNFDLNAELNLVFNHPVAKWEGKPIQFKEDTLRYGKKSRKLFYDIHHQTVSLSYSDSVPALESLDNKGKMIEAPLNGRLTNWKENTPYHLFIPPGTFTDFFGLTNDTIKIDFKTREEKYYGTLKLKINIPETKGQYIVQLLDEKENLVRENFIKKSQTINYNYLYPQKCKLKIIYDDNTNNKWDTGNLLQKQQPEKVIYDAEVVNIRSNWDLELDWKIQ